MVTYQHSHVSFETDYIGLFMTVIVWCITSKYVCKKIEKNQQLWDRRTRQCMISQTSVKLPTVRECFPWYDNFIFSFFSLHPRNISSSPLFCLQQTETLYHQSIYCVVVLMLPGQLSCQIYLMLCVRFEKVSPQNLPTHEQWQSL